MDIPAWASNSVGGCRGGALVAGRAVKVIVIEESVFQNDSRFKLGSRFVIATICG